MTVFSQLDWFAYQEVTVIESRCFLSFHLVYVAVMLFVMLHVVGVFPVLFDY